jgi:thiol-disulfide isomerase/thioredoxin
MKLTTIMLLLLCGLLSFTAKGQNTSIHPLKIGDTIPAFVFKGLKNTTDKDQTAAALAKPGLLIINFWATWCVPCVNAMPYLDSLQSRLTGQYRMLCITGESNGDLDRYLNKNKNIGHLIFLAVDSVYNNYFPHHSLPHCVWIDRNGVIRAITDDDEVTEKNIRAFTEGKEKLRIKKEDLTFDWRNPLPVDDPEFVYRSILTPMKPGISTSGVLVADSTTGKTRFLAWNTLTTELLWAGVMKANMLAKDWKSIEIHTRDSSRFFYPAYITRPGWRAAHADDFKTWYQTYCFCYELSLNRKVPLDKFYGLMAQELSLYFNVTAKVEMRETDCLILTRKPAKFQLKPDTGQERKPLEIYNNRLSAKGLTLADICRGLQGYFQFDPPFTDQTGLQGRFTLTKNFGYLKDNLTLEVFRAYLNEIGLDIHRGKCPYPFLVLYDNR